MSSSNTDTCLFMLNKAFVVYGNVAVAGFL